MPTYTPEQRAAAAERRKIRLQRRRRAQELRMKGLTIREIAEKTGLPMGTVYTYLGQQQRGEAA